MINVKVKSVNVDKNNPIMDYLKSVFVDYKLMENDNNMLYDIEKFNAKINPENYLSYFYNEDREKLKLLMYDKIARPLINAFKYDKNIKEIFKEDVKQYINNLEEKLEKDNPWMVKNLVKEFQNYANKLVKFLSNKKRQKDKEIINEFFEKRNKYENEFYEFLENHLKDDLVEEIDKKFYKEKQVKNKKLKNFNKMLKFVSVYAGVMLLNKFVRMANASQPLYDDVVYNAIDIDHDGIIDWWDVYRADADVEKIDYYNMVGENYSDYHIDINHISDDLFMRLYPVYDNNNQLIGINADWDNDNEIDANLKILHNDNNHEYLKVHNPNFKEIYLNNEIYDINMYNIDYSIEVLNPDAELEDNQINPHIQWIIHNDFDAQKAQLINVYDYNDLEKVYEDEDKQNEQANKNALIFSSALALPVIYYLKKKK